MDRPTTPAEPPMYSGPPGYGDDDVSTPADDSTNQSQIRLLTSMDDSSRLYVLPPLNLRPKTPGGHLCPSTLPESSPYIVSPEEGILLAQTSRRTFEKIVSQKSNQIPQKSSKKLTKTSQPEHSQAIISTLRTVFTYSG